MMKMMMNGKMSKEIKEKCKDCVYYNEKMDYPMVDGQTTHLNCMSIKCDYRKVTKDLKIVRLNNKIADLEAKLAESEKENKRLSKNLRISWTKRMQFYNGLLINKLRDVRDKLDKELFDGYYEKDISVGSVKVVVGAVFDQQINDLRSK